MSPPRRGGGRPFAGQSLAWCGRPGSVPTGTNTGRQRSADRRSVQYGHGPGLAAVDSQRFRLEQPISRGGDLGHATPDTARRAEQQGHPPGLPFVPVADKTLGVLGHLGIGRVQCDGLCACLSVS